MTANNQVISDGYPYRIGSDYSYGWRSQEIIDTLERSPRWSVADSSRLQADDTVRFAADLVPTLLKVKIADPWVGEGQRTLVGWDYSSAAESAAAAYFFVGRAQHRGADLPRRDARGSVAGHRGPLVRRGLRT